jgi:hypothetical protein
MLTPQVRLKMSLNARLCAMHKADGRRCAVCLLFDNEVIPYDYFAYLTDGILPNYLKRPFDPRTPD